MNKHEMSEILSELKTELEANEQLEKHQRESMVALAQEIQARVSDPEVSMSGDEFLLSRLKESTEEFEASHPKLTNIVGRLSNLLAGMGI